LALLPSSFSFPVQKRLYAFAAHGKLCVVMLIHQHIPATSALRHITAAPLRLVRLCLGLGLVGARFVIGRFE
jgi:hypothetical protein